MNVSLELVRDFAIALFIGALIGVDREKRSDPSVGGIRTFTLLALAGALSGWAAIRLEAPLVFAGLAMGVTALVVAGHVMALREAEGHGLTTEIAAVVTFLLGGVALLGAPEIAVVLGIAASALLAFKEPIHGLVDRIGREDLAAGLKLLFATFIVLPLLPDRAIDPWGAINPSRLWLLVILISGLSLVGYVAMRAFGDRLGTVLTGLLGGLVSSTAVTLSFARRSRDEAGMADMLSAGVLGAWAVMFLRVIVEVAVVHAPLLRILLLPLALVGLAATLLGGWFFHRTRSASASKDGTAGDMALKNPFSLLAAAKFAAGFAIVLLAVGIVQQMWSGGGGVLIVAALAGTSDVDAITLSMAEGVRSGSTAPSLASAAILIAASTNTAVKCGLVLFLAERGLKLRIAVATLGMLLLALVSAALMLAG